MKQKILLLLLPLLLLAALYPATRSAAQPPGPDDSVSKKSPAPSKPLPISSGLVPTARKEAPLGLTASDGTGLHLVDLKADAVIEGPLAFTELRLTFENPQDRVLEGRFQITLPDKAAISRFAMKIDGQWQEAEVVERQAAQMAYEDFLHRRQDPALLENAAGNEFSARIFPIPAKGRKELILSYSQELSGKDGAYRLPLQGLPRIGKLELGARVASSEGGSSLTPEIQAIKRENFVPEGDFVVSGGAQPQALRAGDFLVARVKPGLDSGPSTPLSDLLILVDTSASRALGQAEQSEMIPEILGKMPGLKTITVAAFDQQIKQLYAGPPVGFSAKMLLERQALGATDLDAALRWAGKQKHRRLLLISDGVSTAGPEELKAALKSGGLQRLDVLLVGGIRDKERMDILVSDGLAQDGLVIDGDLAASEVARKLALGVTSGVDVGVSDALWVWPSTLDNLQPGDERLVYAQLKNPRAEVKLSLSGQPYPITAAPSSVPPLLQRQAIVAKIARLESAWKEAPDGEKAALSGEIVKLSTTYRVLSDKTALLVLETEDDYARFKIDRKALTDILVVGPEGLLVKSRDEIVVAAVEKLPAQPTKDEKAKSSGGDAEGELSRLGDFDDATQSVGQPAPYDLPAGSATTGRQDEAAAETSAGRVRTAPSSPSATSRPAPRPVTAEPRRQISESSPAPAEDDGIAMEENVEAFEAAKGPALTGPMAEIKKLLQAGKTDDALAKARQWQREEPGNVLALVALGECLEAKGQKDEAARAYGSIIDLFPSRADLRRFAGSRLESLGANGLSLAVDSFGKAVEQRADHVSSHRYLALALARQGNYPAAFAALEKGLAQDYPDGRFLSYERILRDDLGIIGAAWAAKDPDQKGAIVKRLSAAGATLASEPSLRFVLTWETDANDVDFHIHDAKDGHAYYSSPKLPSGGELYGDVTTGYGPECFAIPGKAQAFPYRLQIHYYSRGPMGYGMGQLEILQHDGQGHLLFEERPYLVMEDGAYVDLGIVEQTLSARR